HSSPACEDEPGGERMNVRIDSGKQLVEKSLTTLGRAGGTFLHSLGRAGRTAMRSMDRAGRKATPAMVLVGGVGTLLGPVLGGLLAPRRGQRGYRQVGR